ncbi:MAG TPA: rhodanese-like domain-containing protein [Anaeromyxobacteraceae bacterium]|nr:rhodanese-like domain-containing protein [Anaeromyxobacteraceae bacterium]
MRTGPTLALFVASGATLGLAANALSPHPALVGRPVVSVAEAGGGACAAPGPLPATAAPRISVAEAAALCQACQAAFVDARSATEFARGHVANAVHLPPAGHPDEAAALDALRGHPLVVVYDGDYSCAVADDVAARLRRAGLGDVRVLAGAWPAWAAAGAPAAAGACGVCGVAEAHP